jgi:formate hydrogenlyase subunit 3/multisubunit Na+/H+ antiporter MnhD subunit
MIFNLIAQFGTKGFEGIGVGPFDTSGITPCSNVVTNNLNDIISLILGFLTVLAGLAFLLYFIFGGLQWTLAGGDQGKVDSAKKQMTNGAIGLIIVVISYGIIAVVGSVLGLDLLDPGAVIQSQLNPGCAGGSPDSGPVPVPAPRP